MVTAVKPTVAFAAAEAEAIAAFANLIGDPLPTDWHDPAAVEARQDHLAAIAQFAGEAVLSTLVRCMEVREHGGSLDADEDAVTTLARELVALDRAIRDYTHTTQRGDGLGVVHDAVEFSVGSGVATVVMGLIERLRRDIRAHH